MVFSVLPAIGGASAFHEDIDTFVDDNGNFHEPFIEAIVGAGITNGCDVNPARYCPSRNVLRSEMAAFLVRAMGEEGSLPSYQGYFADVPPGLWYTPYVERLFELGITTGCRSGPAEYCPNEPVIRGQMTVFLLRAIGEQNNLPPYQGYFKDVRLRHRYRGFIEGAYDLGITKGCAVNPLRFCSEDAVPRDQMASFVGRTFGLDPVLPLDFDGRVAATLVIAANSVKATVASLPNSTTFPRSTQSDGSWSLRGASDWTSGFFPALLWRMYEETGDGSFLTWATQWSTSLDGQASRTDTHDLGFMVGLPALLAYTATGTDAYRLTLIKAASSLSSRFDPDVGAVRSWDFGSWLFPVIIDNMMNLKLLRDGANLSSYVPDKTKWRGQAAIHAGTTSLQHIRPDGSSYHVVDFDATTGAVISKGTWQGSGSETTWARGQAWGLHGFAMEAAATGDSARIADAKKMADYFLANLPSDMIPYWDFDAPGIPSEPRDSSAAAIAAAGLLKLSEVLPSGADRTKYFDAAVAILDSLMTETYLSDGTLSEGILLHGTGSKPQGNEINVSLIWGDYYFVEALMLYQDIVGP